MGSAIATAGWITGSILSSCSIIMVNKHVMTRYDFRWPIALTTWHMIVTLSGLELSVFVGWMTRPKVPSFHRWLLGALNIGAIILMNWNLRLNSVGFYQLSKLMVIPAVLIYRLAVEGKKTPWNKVLSLSIQVVGAALFSVNDVQFNVGGAIMALAAVVVCAAGQSKQGSIQADFKINGPQATLCCALPQLILCVISSLILEVPLKDSVLAHRPGASETFWIFLTGLISLSVNLCAFGLIGKCGAVTYQVVGIAKSCLIFSFGLILFPAGAAETRAKFYRKIGGLVIAMAGVVFYAILEIREKRATSVVPQEVEERAESSHKDDETVGLLTEKK